VDYVSEPCSNWGDIFSLSGIKEMNYNQLYKNDPYTSIPDDGLKLETSTGETNYTVGFLE